MDANPFIHNTHREAWRERVAMFAKQHIAPIAAEVDANQRFPRELWTLMGEESLHGLTCGEHYSDQPLGYLAQVIALEEISRASAAVGMSYGAHCNLCVSQLNRCGNQAQKDTFLPKLISGEHVGSLAISEEFAGSDAVSLRLEAQRQGDHFVLNGEKKWITNAPNADLMIVYAKTQPEAGKKGITAFIVELPAPGVSMGNVVSKLGMRGSNTCAVHFKDCRVPADHILGKLNNGVRVLMSGLDYERVVLAAGPVGIMQACLDVVIPYVREREQFGQPIGNFQLIQSKIAEIVTRLGASRTYLYAIASACDNGQITREDAASAIMLCSENAVQTALDAIQCLGANGYSMDYPLERMLRDAKAYEIGAGTSEIRRLLIGRQVMQHGYLAGPPFGA